MGRNILIFVVVFVVAIFDHLLKRVTSQFHLMISDQFPDSSLHLNIDFNESFASISNILNFCGKPLRRLSETSLDHPIDMLNTEWAELEIVELLNDHCGLGFSLMGSKSTGVVIRSIFSGSVTEKNGHLRIGDHLMYIDDINVRGMTSEQVAAILRQCSDHLRLIIARPVPNCSSPEYSGSMSIIPTDQIDQHLDFLVNTLLPVSDLNAMQLYQQMSVKDVDQEVANIYQDQNLLQMVQTQLPPAVFQSTVNTHYTAESPLRRVAGNPDVYKSEKSEECTIAESKSSLHNSDGNIKVKSPPKISEFSVPLLDLNTESRNIRSTSLDNPSDEDNLREHELHPSRLATSASTISSPNSSKIRSKHRIRINEQNEYHEYMTDLTKGEQGLGLTIAGYITCRPEVNIHGIFVKSISKNSVADLNGQIAINDQIIEINNQSVIGLDNPTVVEILKLTTGTVKLKFHRYTKGPVYEILTQTAKSSHTVSSISQSSSNSLIHNKSNSSQNNTMKSSTKVLSLQPNVLAAAYCDESPINNFPENVDISVIPPSAQLANSSSEDEAENSILELSSTQKISSENVTKTDVLIANILPNSGFNVHKMNLKYASIDKTIEDTIKSTWNKIIGNNYDILISYINKMNEGLGISLEGTVDVDDVTGLEYKPHHYIRTITQEGPIGLDGTFRSGDELLEANGKKLHGVPYQEVLASLKSLPNRVQIVAARKKEVDVSQLSRSSSTMLYDDYINDEDDDEYDDDYYDDNENISIDVDYHSLDQMQDLYNHHTGFRSGSFLCHTDNVAKYHPKTDNKIIYEDSYRYPIMTKAKSDNSIFVKSSSLSNLHTLKSFTTNRSLQYLRDVAMWSGPILVELTKENQGLGFSIDYYQDSSSNVPVIVISSLVPNGVAHLDGRIIPGDRLIFINEIEVDALSSKLEVIEALQSLPKGQVLLGIAKPMFPSSYMYRSYSKETIEELSTSQSLEYEPFTLAEDAAIGSTYNSLQKVINTDVRLYQITTCIVQQALHNATIYLREHYDTIVLLPCSSELSDKELAIQSCSSTRENFIDAESNVLPSSISSESSTPRREISPISNKSDPNINLINYQSLPSPDFNHFKGDLAMSYSTIRSDDEFGLKAKIISEQTSSKTPSSDINSSSSIDCLDGLEVTKNSESDTDAIVHYWKELKIIENSDSKETKVINLNFLKKWFYADLTQTIFELDTTKFCELGYPLLNTTNKSSIENICSPGDIITDVNGQQLSEIRPDTINILLNSYRKSGCSRIKIGYISSEDVLKSPGPITQRVYKCSSDVSAGNHINGKNEEKNAVINLTVHQVQSTLQHDDPTKINGWSSPRIVTVERGKNKSLGISILGGKVANVKENEDIQDDKNLVSGIFITHINPDSPAEKCGQLHIGDRLLSVNGIDLINTSYEEAINFIKNATSPIVFIIQSLVDVPKEIDSEILKPLSFQLGNLSHEQDPISLHSKEDLLNKRLITPPNSPEKIPIKEINQTETGQKENSFSISSLSEESVSPDFSEIEARRNSQKSSIDDRAQVLDFEIDILESKGLGLLLVGNKDCSSMNCYICGFKDNSVAAKDGRLMIGDELLKINSFDVLGMSHSNVAPIIKKCQMESEKIMLTIKRHPDNIVKMACIPATINTSALSPNKCDTSGEISIEENSLSAKYNLEGYGEIFQVHLEKSAQGFGFFIMDCNANDEPGIYIKKVTADGIAANEGTLREGDRILLINEELVVNDDYDSVLKKLRGCKNALEMVIGRASISVSQENNIDAEHQSLNKDRRDSIEYQMLSSPPPLQNQMVISPIINEDRKASAVRPSISYDKEPIYSSIPPDRKRNSIQKIQNPVITKKVSVNEANIQEAAPQRVLTQKEHPTKAQIVTGVETVIELTKDRGLGLSIIGGSDTILGIVMIHEVHEKEAAALDGRLWAGDRILAVNGKDLRNATHDQAIQTLRSVGNRVKLKIFRDKQPLCEDSLYFKLKVDLLKKSRKGLGITIVSKSDVGVCISDLVKGSIAEQDGRLKKGDLLLEINDTNVRSYTQDQVATLLKRCSGNVFLMVGRLRSNIYSSQPSSEKSSKRQK